MSGWINVSVCLTSIGPGLVYFVVNEMFSQSTHFPSLCHQTKFDSINKQMESMEMEVMEARLIRASELNGEMDDDDTGSNEKCIHLHICSDVKNCQKSTFRVSETHQTWYCLKSTHLQNHTMEGRMVWLPCTMCISMCITMYHVYFSDGFIQTFTKSTW